MPPRIATFLNHSAVPGWTFNEANRNRLQQALPQAEITVCPDEAAFLAALPTTEIAMVWHFRQPWLEIASRLQWLATPAAGQDYFHLDPPQGLICTYGEFQGPLMAETVVGLMLTHARGIAEAMRLQSEGGWPRAELAAVMRSLRASRVTILGFGRIGQWIGRLAKPFGVRLTGIRRSPEERPDYFDDGDRLVRPDELDTILPETDHLVMALPRGAETDNILNAERIALLPRHAAVYNVGRGNAIDEEALAAALHAGRLGGAYLDVFKTEPLPADAPLRACPNLVVLPHASAISPDYLDLFVDDFVTMYQKRFG